MNASFTTQRLSDSLIRHSPMPIGHVLLTAAIQASEQDPQQDGLSSLGGADVRRIRSQLPRGATHRSHLVTTSERTLLFGFLRIGATEADHYIDRGQGTSWARNWAKSNAATKFQVS